MTRKNLFLLTVPLLMLASGCEQKNASPSFPPSDGAIQARVDAATQRLQKTEGGRLLAAAIEAHGGLKRWYSNGPVSFRWTYHMTDRGPDAVIDTTQVVDTWYARAVHTWQPGEGDAVKFGWDGSETWVLPADAKTPVPASFWSLTPYYFVGTPFVLADPGAMHEKIDSVAFQGKTFEQVKVTFAAGTGESSEDYYIVLIDPESKKVRGVRYIVTHPVVNASGTGPEKLLTYEDQKVINGILWPTGHKTFPVDEKSNTFGEQMRHAEVSDINYVDRDDAFFKRQ